MPWSGGVFSRENGPSPVFTGPTVWQQDAAASILIESQRHDFHDQDLSDGINACLNKNGQNSPTANINWGGFKITNAGYGSGNNDMACYGQVPISASLDSGTNILTLTRPDGNTFTVDLTSLVVGGSTANFAKLNAADNIFVGQAEFGGTLQCVTALTMIDALTLSGSYTWAMAAATSTRIDISNTAGADLRFQGNSGAATLSVNGSTVWTQAALTTAQVASFLSATANANISGSWDFSTGNLTVPGTMVWAATGGAWNTTVSSANWQLFSGATGDVFKLDHDATEGMRAFVNGHRLWTNATWSVIASATPTGGTNGDCALVLSGANQGLWSKVSGTWTKIIAGP